VLGGLILGGLVLGGLVLGGLVLGGTAGAGSGVLTATRSGAAEATAGATGVVTTPVLSVRRLPAWVQRSTADAALSDSLGAIMASPALGGAATSSCLVVRQNGRTRFALRPTLELAPASSMKLFTATAALERLGPLARYTTAVDASRAGVGGVVTGNLYLVGGGDPLLRTPGFVAGLRDAEPVYTSLPQLAADVRAAGVTEVTGGVVGDESRYDSIRDVATWLPVYRAEGDVGPLSALDVDDGLLSAMTGVTPTATPPVQSAELFTTLLEKAGVKVDGAASTATTPAGVVPVASIASPTVAAEVGEILRESDDTGAELLTKELGHHAGTGGSTAAGVAVVRSVLAADGVPLDQVVDADGSGLSTADRATCGALADVLGHAGPTATLAQDLPVAARSGTLRHRLAGTAAAGRVLAKTGTLATVSALSGFVLPAATPDPPATPGTTAPGPATPGPAAGPGPFAAPLVFSLVLDDTPSAGVGVSAGDQVAVALATDPQVPSLVQLGPLPVTPP